MSTSRQEGLAQPVPFLALALDDFLYLHRLHRHPRSLEALESLACRRGRCLINLTTSLLFAFSRLFCRPPPARRDAAYACVLVACLCPCSPSRLPARPGDLHLSLPCPNFSKATNLIKSRGWHWHCGCRYCIESLLILVVLQV